MKVLLDECVPEQVRNAFRSDAVTTVKEMGWRGVKNGRLLEAIQNAGFDLFVVADKNMRFQQNLSKFTFAILELWTNHRPTLEAHFGYIESAAQSIKPGQLFQLPPPP